MKIAAAILLALMTAPAQAYIVSAAVGPLLRDAQTLIAAKDYTGAMAKVHEAEAVKVTADDQAIIDQFKQVIETVSSQPAQP